MPTSENEKWSTYLKDAWEETKDSTKENYDSFSRRLQDRYNDATKWSKSSKEDEKLKAKDAMAKYDADIREAKNKGQNRYAYYLEQVKNSMGSSGSK